MEKVVPEKVEYKVFWLRYYFLRKAIEKEERRRKGVIKGAAAAPAEEDVAWDDDDEDGAQSSTPNAGTGGPSTNSITTLNATYNADTNPASSQQSDEIRSIADSDVSYDIVSGATSRAGVGPKEEKRGMDKEESDDDWE
ncbi:hypothetical protein LTR48_003411 [Friedmanniomyces endolithicus]|uniref:BSD domain-containing protein n=2 Tax=Dothideomycetidae TaxID=451867 RepID=A0AAN6IZX3_9PEZI|nr:hypothetical protein LTS00_017889 [Friedmanniomyces endolithicus]KAK0304135.1 hypothetical protein LTR82_017310 [Friedmanniomyces endolithicus]KAK1054195.1 hypothetical protein LTR74_016014 [Friedmanniomyces endolithicus]KAK1086596.1 hypothetical protein LTR48_003411 [Friedmanniomyces endolithicus]KAK5147766.1 hypothetical protein LTR32_000825 [Rachicladosporium monterosium]